LKISAAAGAGLLLPLKAGAGRAADSRVQRLAAVSSGTQDPLAIRKYVMPLVIPPTMPKMGKQGNSDYYEIAVRQFRQQILPPEHPTTTVWGYGSIGAPGTVAQGGSFNYPAFTIEATYARPVRVKWINDLQSKNGKYLPHLLPVDPTLHWANPPGGIAGRDARPAFGTTPGRYTGPVPIVTHVHGAHVSEESDGYAEAWYLPAAKNIPPGYARTGSRYGTFAAKFKFKHKQEWEPGTAVFQYPNDQRASTLWYHDHTLGMTRLNVYAGPAGFYLLRGGPGDLRSGVLPGPAPALGDTPGTKYYEIPIAIQDRSFNTDGSLFFPDSRAFFDGFTGPYIPESDVSPIWNPEFFGNTMVVNGRTWPYLEVEPRRYRFRFLNGCNSRFLMLKMSNNLPFWQIGTEGGCLPAPVQLDRLLMGLAERADVIVDFSGLAPGTEIILQNLGPDEPFGGGEPPNDFDAADPETTGQVMKFVVVPPASVDTSTPPSELKLPALPRLGMPSRTRQVSLNEMMSMVAGGPAAAMLGIMDNGLPMHRMWVDPITENPALGATEIWEIFNFTADAHPIHLHQVQFKVVDRQALASDAEGVASSPAELVGGPLPPMPWETGYKDTVIAYPGQVTRIKAKFDLPGLYVWHCHIVDHEDNEMMRPFFVGPMR
jgi:bilirubin oxidase